MRPDRSHDEQAMQDFVASLRGHLSAKVMPGIFDLYKRRLEPAFLAKRGRLPKDYREVGEVLTRNAYYQFWSAMQRRSQEMMWDAVIEPTERQLDTLIGKYRQVTRQTTTLGSLRLNPDLEIPRYHTARDIHLQPGGYHSEFTVDDVAAGAIYDNGLQLYLGGALGPENDLLGRILSAWTKQQNLDLQVGAILDMGCAIGNSTLPWHAAYPDATIHAIDVAAPCLRYAHARAEYLGVPVYFSQQNAERTDFPDESFDLIVSHIMLHETSRSALLKIMAESRRLLRSGGRMLHLEIQRGKEPFEQFMLQWEAYNNNEKFARYMTEANLVEIAQQAGFLPGQCTMVGIETGFSDKQQRYTSNQVIWPLLVGEK